MKTGDALKKLFQRLLMVTVMIMSLGGSALAEEAAKDWYVALRLGMQPYTVETSGKAGDSTFDAKADLSDILDNTDTTLAGGEMEFGKGRFFMILNGFYQKTEAETGNSTLGSTTTYKQIGCNPMAGYRVYQGNGETPVYVDVMAGAYYVNISLDVDIHGKLGDVSLSGEDIDFTDAMFGVRAYYGFTKNFGASVFGEVGAGGSELQYVAAANLVYNFTDWLAMSIGYKYWYFKYEDEGKPVSELEQKFYGPTIGVQFKF